MMLAAEERYLGDEIVQFSTETALLSTGIFESGKR